MTDLVPQSLSLVDEPAQGHEKVIVYPGEHHRTTTKVVHSGYWSDGVGTKHDATRPRIVLPPHNNLKTHENLKVP